VRILPAFLWLGLLQTERARILSSIRAYKPTEFPNMRSWKKLNQFDCGSPRPNGERAGGEGIAVLSQRAFVFPHLERFFSLSWKLDAACIAPPHPSPLPRWGEGNEIVYFFTPSDPYVQSEKETNSFFCSLLYFLPCILGSSCPGQ